MKKTLRSLLAYFLAAMLLVQSAPFAFAEGTMPSVMVADNTCTVGSNVTITVTGKDFENLGALPLEFYYDADVLTLNSVTIGSSFQTYFSAINTNNPGTIIVNLAYEEGITVSNATLATLSFTVASDAAAGSTEIAAAVGDARDGDLNTLAVSSSSGTLTIKEKTTTVSTFRLYASASPTTLSKGDTVKLQVYNGNWLNLAGGKFCVSFDDTLFQVKSATFDSGVLQGEYLTEINDDVAGQVTLSYISDTAASKWPLFIVDLEVIGDVDTTTALTYEVIEAYDDNNVAYQTYSGSNQVTLVKLPEVVDYPNFSVNSTEFVVGEEATSTLTLEASDVAAADFTLRFDPEVLEVASVENISTATDANAHVMVDETTWDSGVLNFSYMNIGGTAQDLPLLKITWNVLSAKAETALTLSGTGVKDVNIKDVTLEYVGEISPVYAAIYYNANGGSGTMTDHLVSSGVTTTLNPNIFTRSGYIFTGWNTAANGTGTAYTDKASITVEATVTLYAQWEQLQARWGTVTGTAAPVWEGRGALDKAMTYANGLPSGTAYIQLLDDVATDEPLVFNEGKKTILDLNGKTIDRDLENEAENGNVITVNGNLTLCDTSDTAETAPGKITGGCNKYGGGVYVSLGGTFTMSGGSITKNIGAQYGGGVYNEGTFVMTGGTISGNSTAHGGAGVYTKTGAFTLENGSISGNRFASHGGGVYAESGTFTMKGGTISKHSVLMNGAGVRVQDNCTFTMSGGSITGNVAQVGGGAEIKGTFVMSGGVIKGNTGEVAGGVYLSTGTMQISGAPVVSGNAAKGALNSETGLYEPGETGRLDNVYLSSGKTISVGELTSGTSIGVTMYDPGIFTNGGADYADSSYFTSDNTDYKVSADANGNLKLLTAHISHPTCGAVGCTASHGHSDATFEKLTTVGSSLGTAGQTKSYYLRNDITVSSTITISGTVNLCLNGKTLALEEGKTGSVIFVDRGATLVLCDCSTPSTGKITGGNNNLGGGVNVERTGAFVMNGGSICNNTATRYGGGVYAYGDNFAMNGGTISKNTANYGGGVYTYYNFEMNGGTISKNTAEIGGGVYVEYGTFTMDANTTISGNTAKHGGGVCVTQFATFTMENGTISENQASNDGGGVDCDGTFTMNNGIIRNNTATRYGGGVYAYGDNFAMNGGTISGNTAEDGGGVYAYSDFDMNGGTISGNNASNSGGGVWGTYLSIADGTVTGNTAGHIGGGVSAKNWLSLSGDVKITDNTTDGKANNLHLYSTDAWIAFYDELSDAAKIGITLATIKENTDDGPVLENWTGAFTSYDAATYGSSFFSDNDGYAVSSNGNGQLTLVERIAIDGSVSIGGTVEYGQKLTATYSGNAGTNVTYQWYRDGAAISGATSSSYTLTTDDVGKTIKVVVTGTGIYRGTLEKAAGTVGKATPSVTAPTGLTATYGQTLAEVTLPAGWKWDDAAQSVGNVGTKTFDATYTPTDTTNYKTVNGKLSVNVGKATPTVNIPEAQNSITYGTTLSAVGLTTGWKWIDGNIVPTVQNSGYKAYYTPVDTNNYDWTKVSGWNVTEGRVERTVNVTVVKEDSSCTVPSAVADLVYTSNPQNLVTAASPTGGKVQYSLSPTGTFTTTIPTGANAGTYNVYYKVVGDANHNDTAVLGPVVVEIAKQKVTMPSANTTDFTYNGKVQVYTVATSDLYTVSGAARTAAGEQTVTIALVDKVNYAWVDGRSDDLKYTFTIGKAPLTVAANAKTIIYGAAPANAGVSYNGFVNNENESVLDGTLSYSYSYEQYGNVGSYTITPSGLTSVNYEITFVNGALTVEQKEIGIEWSNTNLTYNGKDQKPTATATGVVHSDEVMLTVSGEQTDASTTAYTATVTTITGNKSANYKLPNDVTTEFTIAPKVMDDAAITLSATSFTYTGEQQKPTVTIKDGETALVEGTDYTLAWAAYCTDVGEYFVIVTFKGNYSGTEKATFSITQANQELLTIAGKPDGTIAYGDSFILSTSGGSGDGAIAWAVTEGSAYAEIDSDGKVTIKGVGKVVITATKAESKNYKVASASCEFTTLQAVPSVTAPIANTLTYTGSTQALVTTGGTTGGTMQYALGTDATTIPVDGWSENVPTATSSGIYYVYYKVVGNDNHSGTTVLGPVQVAIAPKTVTNPKITLSGDSFTYTGSAITPDVVSVMTGTTEIPASEYTVSYSNNTNAGTATVTITDKGLGNYTVSGSKTFTITKADQTAPAVGKVDETISKKADGMITSVGSTMEYSTDGSSYTAISGDKLENLAAGTYYVRVKGDNNHNPSPATTIEIAAGRKLAVTFVAAGNIVDTVYVDYGANVDIPEIPDKVGYTQTAPTWDKDGKNITTDTEINAVYTINKYTVTFKADGTIVDTQTIEHGSDAVLPEIPAKEGYDETAPYWDKEGKNITVDTEINAVYTLNGVTVSGTVTSYLSDTDDVTVELWANDSTTADYTATVKGKSATYSIEGVAVGTYTMKVSKLNHVTREYTVEVDGGDVTQDAKIHPKGDINCDGAVDIGDHQRLFEHLQGVNILSDSVALSIADVNKDGTIDIGDHQRLFEHLQGINPLS